MSIGYAIAAGARDGELLLVVDDHVLDLADAMSLDSGERAGVDESGLRGLLADWSRWSDRLSSTADAVRRAGVDDPRWHRGRYESVERSLGAPLHPRQVLCAASNYAKHVADFADLTPMKGGIDPSVQMPYLFPKGPASVTAPFGEVLHDRATEALDYEVEIGAVIGRSGRRIAAEDAMGHVAGYVLGNDLTWRDLQRRTDWSYFSVDWFAGKAFDGSCPLGPLFVPVEHLGPLEDVQLELSVNGATRQQAPVSQMVFSLPELISFASSVTTLAPGDVLLTGTPDGVAMKTGEWLVAGDRVEAKATGLGRQVLEVVADPEADFRLGPPRAGGDRA